MYKSSLALAFALFLGAAISGPQLHAQQAADQPSAAAPASSPQQPAAQPQDPNQAAPGQPSQQAAPDTQAQPMSGQSFAGTIVKTGSKYMLQDEKGTKYDIDHQDIVAKYEGKKVRVNGTLDPDGKTIHVK